MPILAHCLLETSEDTLRISATDYEVSFRGYYPAQILESGGLSVPAVNFFNIVRELPPGLISLESTENHNLLIKTGELRYQFLGLAPENFPPLPKLESYPSMVALKSAALKEMLEKTSFSIASDDLQQQLAGVYLEKQPEGNTWRLVSSDGHRLSLIDRKFETAQEMVLEQGILIPRKGVAEMLRLLGEGEDCALGLEKKSLLLKQGSNYMFIRLLEKKFPDYRRIIPGNPQVRLVIGRRAFLEILKRISLLSSEKFKGVILRISEGWLDIRYHNPEVGGGDERLPVMVKFLQDEPEGERLELPFEVSYNARYLMEPLNVMLSEEVTLELTEKKKPMCLREIGDPDYLSIVMPMDI
jgi:DNA polymerase-3 subunit beta